MNNSEITVMSPKGNAISRIKTPFKRIADISFGGFNGMTMYIAGPCDAQKDNNITNDCLYKSPPLTRGSAWAQLQQ
jgi:sugar lactone lactonase YvrE